MVSGKNSSDATGKLEFQVIYFSLKSKSEVRIIHWICLKLASMFKIRACHAC